MVEPDNAKVKNPDGIPLLPPHVLRAAARNGPAVYHRGDQFTDRRGRAVPVPPEVARGERPNLFATMQPHHAKNAYEEKMQLGRGAGGDQWLQDSWFHGKQVYGIKPGDRRNGGRNDGGVAPEILNDEQLWKGYHKPPKVEKPLHHPFALHGEDKFNIVSE